MAEDDESRFVHLLQPIRDLAVNWDIDVAHALEEYLDDLQHLTITLSEEMSDAVGKESEGEGSHQVNFAEAALLIQGSALIYSRKVEYLHQLVIQTLGLLTQQRTEGDKKKGKHQDSELTEEEAAFGDPRQEFLALDDVIEEGKDIDIDQHTGHSQHQAIEHPGKTPAPMMAALLKEDHGNSFRMNSCQVHASGALLIGSGGGVLNQLDSLVSPANRAYRVDEDTSAGLEGAMMGDDLDDFDDDSVGGDYGGGCASPVPSTPQHAPPTPAKPAHLFATQATPQQHTVGSAAPTVRKSDPWAMLDPHDPSITLQRPVKKGKTYKLPAELSKPSTPASRETDQAKKEKPLRLQGLCHSEFSYLITRERKRAFAERREKLKVAQLASAEYGQAGGMGNDDDEDDDSFAGDGDDNLFDPLAGFEDDGGINDEPEGGGFDFGLESLTDKEVNPVHSLSLDDAFESAPRSYEELCRAHIASFIRGADLYAHETQLSKRVSDWQTRLEPMLEEQRQRRPFDIHQYGAEILDDVAEKVSHNKAKSSKGKRNTTNEKVIPFNSLVSRKPSYEVCRVFLASLQLANSGNVMLHHTEGAISDVSEFQVELINQKIDLERFDSYLAPSLGTNH